MVSCAFQNDFFPDAQLPAFRQPVYADRYKPSGNKPFLSIMPTGGYRMTAVGLQGAYKMTTVGIQGGFMVIGMEGHVPTQSLNTECRL